MPAGSDSDQPQHGAVDGLSPNDANRLWEKYCAAGGGAAGREALDRLYRSLRRPLVEFCRLKGCDSELADETAEATFIRLIVRKPAARRGFIPLLRKTAQNLCYDALKARRRTVPSDAPIRALGASDGSIDNETVQAVRDCLNTLKPEDRALVLYHHVDGLTQRAACDLLGLDAAPSTITVRLKQIRDQLARCLKKKLIL